MSKKYLMGMKDHKAQRSLSLIQLEILYVRQESRSAHMTFQSLDM